MWVMRTSIGPSFPAFVRPRWSQTICLVIFLYFEGFNPRIQIIHTMNPNFTFFRLFSPLSPLFGKWGKSRVNLPRFYPINPVKSRYRYFHSFLLKMPINKGVSATFVVLKPLISVIPAGFIRNEGFAFIYGGFTICFIVMGKYFVIL